MAAFVSTLAAIVASYLPSAVFLLGCGVAIAGTGYLVLRALDALAMYVIASGPAYADLLRFLRWRFRTPDKSIDPLRLYEAANALYKSARWVANNLSPEHQTELWTDLRNALRLPDGTATAMGLGAPIPPLLMPVGTEPDDDPLAVVTRIAYCNAQCTADAMMMRDMAQDYLARRRGLMASTVQPGLLPVQQTKGHSYQPWVRVQPPTK